MSVLRADDLTPGGLEALLRELRFPEYQTVRAWLEGIDGWTLDYWPRLDGQVWWYGAGRQARKLPVTGLLQQITAGRIFAPAGELRWRLLPSLGDASCRTVYLGDDLPAVAGLPQRAELDDLKDGRGEVEVPLWGRLTRATRGLDGQPDAWVELRVPHRFHYPVRLETHAPSVGVLAVVETWKDAWGELHFSRLMDLRTYAGE